jgi:hypothetical protein
MLFHLVAVEHFADRQRDGGGATQRRAMALDPELDVRQIAFRGGQQLVPLAPAFSGQIGIAADHQPLAREVG